MKILLIGCLLLAAARSMGQVKSPSVVNTAGATIERNGQYSHSFSIGEIVTTTISSNTQHLTQGFLQPEAKPEEAFDFYPNPLGPDHKLNLKNAKDVKMIRVYDLSGREVLSTPYSSGNAIPLDELSGATYLVNTYNKAGKLLHKFIIIKP